MADVFISYSRKDSDFVRRLHNALADQKRDSWVDWEDIPLTADWWEEICRGIEAADTFIFIISPDSVQSEVCGRELAHAVKHEKRLVPVVRHEIADQDIHTTLKAHNWLFFRPSDDFDAAFQNLLKALDTDLDHVRLHTRLLVRAVEWQQSNQNASYALRGDSLQQAEAWLFGSASKEPRPAALHNQYIQFSRQLALARQRSIMAGVLTALVVAVGLALLAFVQYRSAETQRTIAVANAQTATIAQGQAQDEAEQRATQEQRALQSAATAVAAQSVAERRAEESQSLLLANYARRAAGNGNLDLALALALQANSLDQPPIQSQTALAEIAFQPGTRRFYTAPKTLYSAGGVAFSPAINRVVSGGSGVFIWNAETGQHVRTLTAHQRPVLSVSFSPDGRWLLSGSADAHMILWDTSNWTMVRDYMLPEAVNAVAFSPDGQTFLAATGTIRNPSDNFIILWDTTTQREIQRLIGHTDAVMDAQFSQDNQIIVSASTDETMIVWDTATGEQIRQFGSEEQSWIFNLAFSPDGTQILAAMDYGKLILWDPATGEKIRQFEGHQGRINDVAFSPNGQQILSAAIDIYGGYDNAIRLWDVNTGQELLRFGGYPLSPSSDAVLFTPDGRQAFSATGANIRLWDLDTSVEIQRYRATRSHVNSLAASSDGARLLSGSTDGKLRLWDTVTSELLNEFTLEGSVHALFGADDETALVTAGSTFYIWDLAAGEIVQTMNAHAGPIYDLAMSPDGTQVLTASADQTLILWDLATGTALQRLQGHTGAVYVGKFHPDGTRALSGSQDQTLILWDLTTGEMLRQYVGHENGVFSIAFTPDGQFAFSGSGDKGGGGDYSIRAWDVATGHEQQQLLGNEMTVNGLTVSPDGRLLLSVSGDETVRAWDIATGEELQRYSSHQDDVSAVIFSPDGRTAFSADGDHVIIRWRVPLDIDALIAWTAENRYVREFTCQERLQYRVEPLCAT